MKVTAQWRGERPSTHAVKMPAPLLHSLPGGGETFSPPDQMHTWHHGVGREFCSSAIAPCPKSFASHAHALAYTGCCSYMV